MSLNKWIEIYCDYCGCAEHFPGNSIKIANQLAKDSGWIVKSDGTHYDSSACYEKGYFRCSQKK